MVLRSKEELYRQAEQRSERPSIAERLRETYGTRRRVAAGAGHSNAESYACQKQACEKQAPWLRHSRISRTMTFIISSYTANPGQLEQTPGSSLPRKLPLTSVKRKSRCWQAWR
jgi:hypothetical protein